VIQLPSTSSDRLYQSVVQRLLDHVASVDLQPGQPFPPERELATQMGISRNVLREAFRVLEEWGLVQSRRGSGRYLREVPSGLTNGRPEIDRLEVASIADVLESRLLLEERIVTLAAQRRTRVEALEIVGLAKRLDSWQDNVDFHVGLARATHNFMLERMLAQHLELLGALRQREHYEQPEAARELLEEHRELADAISSRDEQRARALIANHLRHTRRSVGVADDDG
jgi:GntR family transcriptional repressor for pyruvate dehydrogenase complex/GntR family L-lactate dehydrogenase operon transcriptional regulator